jgi:UTP-glucose-1-phosphate uridylyltransferase
LTDPTRKQTLTIRENVAGQYIIVVTVTHDKNAKEYAVRAQLSEDFGNYTRSTYYVFGDNPSHLLVRAIPAARFSRKVFDALCDATLGDHGEHFPTDAIEQLRALAAKKVAL